MNERPRYITAFEHIEAAAKVDAARREKEGAEYRKAIDRRLRELKAEGKRQKRG